MIGTVELQQLHDIVLAMTLTLPRLMVCMFLVPIFDATTIPRAVRIAIAIGLSLPVTYGLTQTMHGEHPAGFIAVVTIKEAFLGLVLGIALAAPFWTVSGVGVILDNQRGANAGSQGTPMGKADESMIGLGLQHALVVLLINTGGLIPFYQLLLASYDAWPILSLAPDLSGADAAAMFGKFSEFTRLALLYSAPVVGSLLLIDFAFALVGLAAPSLQTYFAAMPVKSLVGIFVVAVYTWVLLDLTGGYFRRALEFDSAVLSHAVKGEASGGR